MKDMNVKNIALACKGSVYINYNGEIKEANASDISDKEITCAVIDSRLIEPSGLFIATKGERVDGHDFIKGVFEKGSRLLIRWINKEENPEEWNEYLPKIDSQEAQNIPDRKRWIFIAEVIHPDGVTRYEKLDQSVPLYIQKGEDWDTEEGVEAYFISQGADERLNKEYIDNMAYPGGNGGFFKLDLLHFSPYTIYDADPVSSSQNNNGSEKDGNQNKDGEDSQNKSNQENTKNGVNPWYMVAGVGLLGMSLLIGFLIYKKRKKEKDAVMYSILAQIGKSSTSN